MEKNNNQNPLSELLLDADELNREQLAKALKKYIGIDSKSGRIVLKPGFNDLKAKQKVLTFLLGRKVATLLGKIDSDEIAAKDISEATGLPSGTVLPKLKELKEDRLVSQNESSAYYVAPYQISMGVEELIKSGGKNEQ